MLHFWLYSVNQKRCCLSSPVTRRTHGLFINIRWASTVSWVSLAHTLFPRNIFVVFTACRWSIRHFEVARETGSRWLSKCIVGLFWGTNLPPCWKCVPQKESQNALWNHLDAVSRATSKWRIPCVQERIIEERGRRPVSPLGLMWISPKLFLDQLFAWINRKLVSGVEMSSGEN